MLKSKNNIQVGVTDCNRKWRRYFENAKLPYVYLQQIDVLAYTALEVCRYRPQNRVVGDPLFTAEAIETVFSPRMIAMAAVTACGI